MLMSNAYHQLGLFKKGIFGDVEAQPSLSNASTSEAFTDRTQYPSVVMLDTW